MEQQKLINIKPIFNQTESDKIWEDFINIEMLARNARYGHLFLDGAFGSMWDMYESNIKNYKYNFAFGAYDEDKMVGFASGFLEMRSQVYLNSLFVHPNYFGMRIGRRLLDRAEKTSAVVAKEIYAKTFENGNKYYKERGYFVNPSHVYVRKEFAFPLSGIIPVFQWFKFPGFKFNCEYDSKTLTKIKYQPKYVYINEKQEIDGLATITNDGETLIRVNPNLPPFLADNRRKRLENELMQSR